MGKEFKAFSLEEKALLSFGHIYQGWRKSYALKKSLIQAP